MNRTALAIAAFIFSAQASAWNLSWELRRTEFKTSGQYIQQPKRATPPPVQRRFDYRDTGGLRWGSATGNRFYYRATRIQRSRPAGGGNRHIKKQS